MKVNYPSLLRYVFFLVLGIFFIWLSVKNLTYENWVQIKQAVHNGRKWVFIPVILMLLLAHYSRAVRWKLLMEPLGYRPSMFNTFSAVMIGYLVNSGVPRLGELFKCTLLARYEKVKVDKLVGTIIVERAVDVICLFIIFILAIIFQGHIFGQFLKDLFIEFFKDKTGEISTIKVIGFFSVVTVFILLFYFILKRYGHIDIVNRIKTILKNIIQGLSSIRYLEHKGAFIAHSLFIWLMYLLASTAGLYALLETEHLGIYGGLTTLAIGSVGIILTPGGIGAYPLLIAQLLGLYGLDPDTTGNASGWLLWSAQTVIILVGGLVCFILISRVNKKKLQPSGS